MLQTRDFFFNLPDELIAKYPPAERGDSRLLFLDRSTGKRRHVMVNDLPAILAGKDFLSQNGKAPLMVFNNSHVRKARLFAESISPAGGKTAEVLLLYRIDSYSWQCLINHSKRKKPGCRYRFEDGIEGELIEPPSQKKTGGDNAFRSVGMRCIRFSEPIGDAWLDKYGHVPLPPYIKREDECLDNERYQTIYADSLAGASLGPGASAAAPTAGLHFTDSVFGALDAAGIERVFITLHTGLGTFLPVRTEYIEDHEMHEEFYSISEDAAWRINAAMAQGRKIVGVGTTAVRTLESACCREDAEGEKKMFVKAGEGSTNIFIFPGYVFNIVDVLFTNFHTPCSTLLMLVSAFAEEKAPDRGRQLILESYAEALAMKYRFFSYGDAMLIF